MHDVGVVQRGERVVLAAQRLLGGFAGEGDLQRAGAAAHEVAGGVHHRHAALAEAGEDLVVGADAGARVEVVGVERRAAGGEQRLGGAGVGLAPVAHGVDGLGEALEAVGGAQRHHAAYGFVEAERDALGEVAHPARQLVRAEEGAGVVEQRLPGEQQGEDGAEAELVGGGLGAAEGGDDLGGGELQALVGDGGEEDGGVARELLGEVEAGDPQLAGLGRVLHQDDLGPQEAVHHALLVGLVERVGEAHPQVGAGDEVGGLRAAGGGAVAVEPGGQRDAAEVLQRQHDAGFVGEGRVGAEDARAAAEAAEHLGLPAGALDHALALGVGRQRRHAVDAQQAQVARERVLAEQLGEGLLLVERLHHLVLAHPAHGPRAALGGLQHAEQVVLGGGGGRERAAAAQPLGEGLVLQRRQHRLAGVHPPLARWSLHPHLVGGGEEDEVLHPHLPGGEALALELVVEDLRRQPVEPQGARDRLVAEVPVVVGALDAPAPGLDLHHVEGVRRDDDGVELVDHAGALDDPGVAVDGVRSGQAVDQERDRLALGVVGGLAQRDEVGRHGSDQQDAGAGEPDLELVLRPEQAALVGVEADHEVEAALAERVILGAQGAEVGGGGEARVGRAEVERDDAGQRALLPGAAGDGEVVLQRDALLGGDQVVGELAAGAGQLQHALAGLDDVQLGAGEAAGEAEEAGLAGDVLGAGRVEPEARQLGEPAVDQGLGEAVDPEGAVDLAGGEGHLEAVDGGGVFEQQRDEVDVREAPLEAPPGRHPRLGEARRPATGGFVAGQGVEEGGRVLSGGSQVRGRAFDGQSSHPVNSRGR